MTTTEHWIGGGINGAAPTLAWSSALNSTELNSLANGNAVLTATQIDNTSALDLFADVELVLGSLAAVAPNWVGLYLYPLNSDGTTYGDGSFTTAAAGPPPSNYYCDALILDAATQAQQSSVRGILLPPGKFKWVLWNQAGVAFAASGNALKMRTYNRSLV